MQSIAIAFLGGWAANLENIEEQSKSYFGYAENEIEIFNTKEMLYAEKKLNLYLVVEFAKFNK